MKTYNKNHTPTICEMRRPGKDGETVVTMVVNPHLMFMMRATATTRKVR